MNGNYYKTPHPHPLPTGEREKGGHPLPTGEREKGEGKIEKSLINTLLVICLALGFICIAAIYLPAKVGEQPLRTLPVRAEPVEAQTVRPSTSSGRTDMMDRGDLSRPHPYNNDGTYARFTPEPAPPSPFMIAQAEDENVPVPRNYLPLCKGESEGVEKGACLQREGTTRTYKQTSLAIYDPSKKEAKGNPLFTVPAELEADVNFWRDIYAKYDSHKVVMHDMKYLSIVYGVLDFTNLDADTSITDIEKQRQRQATIDAEREQIVSILKQIELNPSADQLSDRAFEIKKMFRISDEPNKFKAAKERVRAQTGQRDKFIIGLQYSGRYLGEIESIFEQQGLPRELTFLIFVESMFNPAANSSAGARGIWQFMRGTGKIYGLKINSLIDERADPMRSTYAAANLFRHDYEMLGSWPLAINAYNTGRGRIDQAIAQLGTTNIATIVKNFDHPAYGFASRNFYVEFLAALDVAKNCHRYFGNIQFDPPLRYDLVRVSNPVMLPKIAQSSGVPIETIAEMNPAYSHAIFDGKLPLPAGSELRVPEKKGERFLAWCARAPQTFPLWHIVADGETIQGIASMYNVPVVNILKANKLAGRRLSVGQEIKITR